MNRPYALLATALVLLAAVELPAQGRGRRGARPDQAPPTPAPEAKAEPVADQKPKTWLAIVGGDVYLGTGQRLSGATVLIANDKIEAVGHNLTLPEGTTVIDAKGKTVSPGFVAVQGYGMGAGRSGPEPTVPARNAVMPDARPCLISGSNGFTESA
jgi:hypothetical protein